MIPLAKPNRLTRFLLACGPVGCILCTTVFLLLGSVRENYSTFRYPVSSLALENPGWIQTANFITSGILVLLFSMGFGKVIRPLQGSGLTAGFIALVGIGLIGAAVFVTDPVYGYPEYLPLEVSQVTVTGRLHEVFSMLVFMGLPIAALRMRKQFNLYGEQGWAVYSLWSAVAVWLFLVLSGIGFKQVPGLVAVAGLFQRLCIISGCLWLTLMAFHLMRRGRNMN